MPYVESKSTTCTSTSLEKVKEMQLPLSISKMDYEQRKAAPQTKSDECQQKPNVIEEGSVSDCNDCEHHDDQSSIFAFDDIDDVMTIFDPFPLSDYKSDLQFIGLSSSLLDDDIIFSPTNAERFVLGETETSFTGSASKRKVSMGYSPSSNPSMKRMRSALETLPPLPLQGFESGTVLLTMTGTEIPSTTALEKGVVCSPVDGLVDKSVKDMKHFQNIHDLPFDDITIAVCSLDSTTNSHSSQGDSTVASIVSSKRHADNNSNKESTTTSDLQAKIRLGLEKLIRQFRMTSESRQKIIDQLQNQQQPQETNDVPKSNLSCYSTSQESAKECTEAAETLLVDIDGRSTESTLSDVSCFSDSQADDLMLTDFDDPSFQY
jgi:hypothetical protein